MPLREYKCLNCGAMRLFFPDEGDRRLSASKAHCAGTILSPHYFIEQPVQPVVVHSTEQFMVENGYLDSLGSIYELDRILNLEAREAKELTALEKVRKET